MKKYRAQIREFEGLKRRAFGGDVASYSPWRTIGTHTNEQAAIAQINSVVHVGMRQGRVMFGSEIRYKAL